jgi:hypothetical protein
MTPKEKAFELYFKFYRDIIADNNRAKQSALIAVDEIYKLPLKVGQYLDNEKKIEMYFSYWENVKEEIENL